MGTSKNRFDFIRLVLASTVFVYHAVVLARSQPGAFEPHLAIAAELAIQGFFIVSGALVYGSWEKSRGLADFAGKRVRRLYPAYAVIVLIPALVSLFLTFGQAGAIPEIGHYLGATLIFLNFLQPELPGLFEEQRFSAVNGSLWTLKIEVMFYMSLPLLALLLKAMGRYWWLGIAGMIFGALVWQHVVSGLETSWAAQLSRQLPGQMMYFAAGMAMWRLWDKMRAHAVTLFCLGLFTLTISLLVPALDALRVLGLAALVAGIAFGPGPELNAARWGDISYGVYILHFPIVQALVALGVFSALGMIGGLAASALLVFGLSYVLWWGVEKPALRRDSHYRQMSEQKEAPCPNTKPSNWTPQETALPS